ncbi:hypothetical protein SAMN05421548_12947 [Paraburkholderia lycopersici]|uniref:Uncharacterized protein n=1 Tax=Paraburkholderia lycopersici TaxID=416944 RepID=A0A1G6Z3M8_9BURK|nr:hypothetical protein SAMN05421548_12947 [Paraburkholderia lycopersici]
MPVFWRRSSDAECANLLLAYANYMGHQHSKLVLFAHYFPPLIL